MIRKNAESFPRLDLQASTLTPSLRFFPTAADAKIRGSWTATRRSASSSPIPSDVRSGSTFKGNRFALPGDPNGLAEGFTTPHDTSHVLSGYTTSPQGELLVSTFIGAMHPDHPMAAEVLPVLFSWHLGIALNEIAGSQRDAVEPQTFWTARERGAATTSTSSTQAGTSGRQPNGRWKNSVALITCSQSIRPSLPERDRSGGGAAVFGVPRWKRRNRGPRALIAPWDETPSGKLLALVVAFTVAFGGCGSGTKLLHQVSGHTLGERLAGRSRRRGA